MGRIRFAFPPLSAVVCAAFLVGTGAVTRSETPAVAAGQSDPASVALLSPAIARHFPEPARRYETPAFTPGREGFPAHDEVLAFARGLALRHPSHVTFEVIGASQEGREVPLLIFAAGGRALASRPTVLVIGQQHGNEPAGEEGALAIATELAGPRAALLNHVNVFIVPRANPVRGRAPVAAGDFYISMAQPLGAIVAAALEPDSQSSFAANGLLDIEHGGLRRVMTPLPARALVRDDSSDTARAPPIQ